MAHFLTRTLLVLALSLVATVSTTSTPFCAGALHAQAQGQDPVMPPEGNPNDDTPPPGAYCDHSDRAAHACKCHNRCDENPDGSIVPVEDGKHCRAYCHKDHCHCPWDGCKTPEAR